MSRILQPRDLSYQPHMKGTEKCSDECDKKLIIYCNLIEKPHKANKSGYKLLNTIFYCRLLIEKVHLVSTNYFMVGVGISL